MRMILPALFGAALALAPFSVHADPTSPTPFTVEDLLHLEEFGQTALSPREDSAVFERLGPVDGIPSHEHDYWDRLLRSELFVVPDLETGEVRRMLAPEEGNGHALGPWSSEGDRVVLYRLKDRRFSLGIAEPRTGAVRWANFTPELAFWGRAAIWQSPEQLLVLATDDEPAPWLLRAGWTAADRLPKLWERARRGDEAARTVIGSGRFADLTPQAASGRLMRVDVATGREEVLATGRFYDMELSPNGRYLALAAYAEDVGFDPQQPFLQGDFSQRRALTILDLQTGAIWRPAPEESLSPHLLSWSADGETLLAFLRPAKRAAVDGRLMRFRPADGQATVVPLHGYGPAISESGLRTPVVSADWLGETPVLFAQTRAGRKDWVALGEAGAEVLTSALSNPGSRLLAVTRSRIVVSSDGRAWSVGPSAAPQDLGDVVETKAADHEVVFNRGQRFAFTGAPRRNWVAVRRGAALQRVDIETGASIGPASPLEGDVRAMGETKALTLAEDPSASRRLVGPGGTTIAVVNAVLAQRSLSHPIPVAHVSRTGRRLTSWLYRPVDNPHAPLIVVPYPGASVSPEPRDRLNAAASVQLMTGRGYAVLLPDLSDIGRPPDPASGIATAILAAVDAAALTGGFDRSRLILWGHSFGGFSVMAAASQSDRFSAVIAANGAYDLPSAWGSFSLARAVAPELGLSIRSTAGLVETGQFGLGGPPWSSPQAYVANSPLFAADRIQAPVLLVTADRDYVAPGQAEEMFSALYRQGKDAVLLTYRGEGHVLASPGNIRDYYAMIWAWLDRVMATVKAPGPTPAPNSPSAPAS